MVVLGAGVLGRAAARAFLGAGASVHLLDRALPPLEEAAREAPGAITALVTQDRLERYVAFADVLVGAVAVPGERTPFSSPAASSPACAPEASSWTSP